MQRLRDLPDDQLPLYKDEKSRQAAELVYQEYNREERLKLKKEIETYWARITVPIGTSHMSNSVAALYEFTSAAFLFRPTFFIRQGVDVLTQGAIHTPTAAMQLAWDNINRNMAEGKPAEAWAEVSTAIADAYSARLRSYKQALLTATMTMTGQADARNVDQLVSKAALFERALQKIEEYRKAGDNVRATILTVFSWIRMGRLFAAAADNAIASIGASRGIIGYSLMNLDPNDFDAAYNMVPADNTPMPVYEAPAGVMPDAPTLVALHGIDIPVLPTVPTLTTSGLFDQQAPSSVMPDWNEANPALHVDEIYNELAALAAPLFTDVNILSITPLTLRTAPSLVLPNYESLAAPEDIPAPTNYADYMQAKYD